MNRYLVPTDFSDNSRRAVEYAINLANRAVADITLFHAFPPAVSERIDEYVRQNAEQQMEQLEQACRPLLREGSRLTGVVIAANPVTAIVERAAHDHADLILLGTQGEGGIKGFLMGSTTLEVLRRTHTAVLAIPQTATFQPPREVVLAIDQYSVSDAAVLRPLTGLARLFRATVRVYRQNDEEEELATIPDLLVDEALAGIDHTFHPEHRNNKEVWAGILAFAIRQQADLLCLIRRERSWIERLFHRSVTREELSASPIPLLFLPDEK